MEWVQKLNKIAGEKKETTLRGKTKEYKKKNSKHNSASTLHTYDN